MSFIVGLLLFPLLALFLVKSIEFKIGSIDGWLGFLGGYSGGLLAFLSAYFIFRKGYETRTRTWIRIHSIKTDNGLIKSIGPSLIFDSEKVKSCFDPEERMFTTKGLYPITAITLKNVSDNFAKKVSLVLINRISKNTVPMIHHKGRKDYIGGESIGDLEAGESFTLIMHVDPTLYEGKDFIDFEVNSLSLDNQLTRQKVRLHLNKSVHAWDFELRT